MACPNPVTVEEFSGTEDRRTPEFEITGTAFRLTWDIVDIIDPNGSPSLEADVLDDSGRPIGEGFLAFEEDGSENILEGPGTFSLEIRASDVRYEIVVEDCTGTSQDGDTTMGPPTLQPSPTLGPRWKRDVIRETIPKKTTPSHWRVVGVRHGDRLYPRWRGASGTGDCDPTRATKVSNRARSSG